MSKWPLTIEEFIKLGTCDSSHGSNEKQMPESVNCDFITCIGCPAYTVTGNFDEPSSCIQFYYEKKREYISGKLDII